MYHHCKGMPWWNILNNSNDEFGIPVFHKANNFMEITLTLVHQIHKIKKTVLLYNKENLNAKNPIYI